MKIQTQVNEFYESVKDLTNSRFILAERKIDNLMRTIAQNDFLYGAMEECVEGFDFSNAFETATQSGNLKLPLERKNIIAFVFCLLNQFDSKQLDLQEFLENVYPELNCFSAFSEFCENCIVIFANAFAALVLEKEDEAALDEPVVSDFFGNEFVSMGANTVLNLTNICEDIAHKIESNREFSSDDREKILFLLLALKNAILTRDKKLIKAMFLGVKYALKGSKSYYFELKDITEVLKELWVI